MLDPHKEQERLAEILRYKAEIFNIQDELSAYKNFGESLYTKLLSYQSDTDYQDWNKQICAMIELIQSRYNERFPIINQLLQLLLQSYGDLICPINHSRYIILGKTRTGKSNLANALTFSQDFKTSSEFRSQTKSTKAKQIAFGDHTFEFVDTQGLGDTDAPHTVLPNIKQMIEKMNFQYHGLIYVMKYQSLLSSDLQEALTFIENIFGPTAKSKTILVFTSCPKDRRFLPFDYCKQLLVDDLLQVDTSKDLISLLHQFHKIKFVDLGEVCDGMDADEVYVIEKKRRQEADVMLNGLKSLKNTLSDPEPLRVTVLTLIKTVHLEFCKLGKLKKSLEKMDKMISKKDAGQFFLRKVAAFLFEGDDKLKSVYGVGKKRPVQLAPSPTPTVSPNTPTTPVPTPTTVIPSVYSNPPITPYSPRNITLTSPRMSSSSPSPSTNICRPISPSNRTSTFERRHSTTTTRGSCQIVTVNEFLLEEK